MFKSWKTTLLGALILLGSGSQMVMEKQFDPNKIIGSLIGAGLIAAKDHDK